MKHYRLDELYKMTSHIYSEQNFSRSVEATFLHFVEVCGLLTILARKKNRDNISFEDSICKALGWFFPLMAKCEVESIEQLIFRKFPMVCPYCRLAPHKDRVCKVVIGNDTVDHMALKRAYNDNQHLIPTSLNGWMKMFDEIYPRATGEISKSTIGLMEELGELAEALRVRKLHPKFLAGEAADVFSYLMGIANEYSILKETEGKEGLDLDKEYLSRYPGLCPGCGDFVCTCPSVPASTIGRMSKELDIENYNDFFIKDTIGFNIEGEEIARDVLMNAGGFEAISDRLPMDRGQVHASLLVVCLKLANELKIVEKDSESENMRNYALSLAQNITTAGVRKIKIDSADVLKKISEGVKALVSSGFDIEKINILEPTEKFVIDSVKKRILVVTSSPLYEPRLNIQKEVDIIKNCINASKLSKIMELHVLENATIDSFRKMMNSHDFNIIHFCGHGAPGIFQLEDENGQGCDLSLTNLREYMGKFNKVDLTVFSSCSTLKGEENPLGNYTIGMDKPIEDEEAIEFTKGLFDGILAGYDIPRAIEEGESNLALKGYAEIPLVKLGFK